MSLDLEDGDEELAETLSSMTPAQRRRRARREKEEAEGKGTSKPKPAASRSRSSRSSTARDRVDTELLSRLDRVFDRIALALETRNDTELASIIRQDSEAMSQGLVSLTRGVTFLRGPFLMLLNLVEPALAFGRVGRHLYIRWAERQQRIAWERQQNEPPQEAVSSFPVEAGQ